MPKRRALIIDDEKGIRARTEMAKMVSTAPTAEPMSQRRLLGDMLPQQHVPCRPSLFWLSEPSFGPQAGLRSRCWHVGRPLRVGVIKSVRL